MTVKYRLFMGAIVSACVTLSAHADLLNISATSLQSTTEEAIACTIIATGGLTYQGYKVLVVYAEGGASDSNARLTVRSLTRGDTYTNDDWLGTIFYQGQSVGAGADLANLYAGTLGRTPSRTSDSAALVLFSPGEPVCAYSREVSNPNLKRVSVSITDITNKIQGTRSLTTQETYLLEKWFPAKSK